MATVSFSLEECKSLNADLIKATSSKDDERLKDILQQLTTLEREQLDPEQVKSFKALTSSKSNHRAHSQPQPSSQQRTHSQESNRSLGTLALSRSASLKKARSK